MKEHQETRASRLNLYPGNRGVLVLDVEIIRRRDSPTGPVLGVLLPQEIRSVDFAAPSSGEALEAAGVLAQIEKGGGVESEG